MPRKSARLRHPAAQSLALGCALALLLAMGCASDARPARAPEQTAEPATLVGYDAAGRTLTCETPREHCSESKTNRDFADRCRLAGYRLLRCGCDDVCSGNVKKQESFFDSSGQERSCAPEQEGCTPPETSARFQDACTDARHKLVVCGCEWLCNGPLRAAKPNA